MAKDMTGIDVRHKKGCKGPREDGKCCNAGFQAQVFDKRTGKQIRRTFTNKTAASNWRGDAMSAIRSGKLEEARPKTQTVNQALEDLLAGMKAGTVLDRSGRRYRPGTIRAYTSATNLYLKPAIGRHRLTEVRRRDVQRLVDQLAASGHSGSSCRNKLDALRVVYRRALEDDEITSTPLEHLRFPEMRRKAKTIVAPEQAAALLAALPDQWRALWTVLFYCGLRIGEARALRWTAVDLERGVIRVEHGWDDHDGEQDPKTHAGFRVVPMTALVRAELARHSLDTGRDGTDLVFGTTPTRPFSRVTVRRHAIEAWTGAAVTPHTARHCAASYFAMAGLSLKEAQEALGHADARTTLDIYQHALPGWQEQAANKLDTFLGATVARQSTPDSGRSAAVPERSGAAA